MKKKKETDYYCKSTPTSKAAHAPPGPLSNLNNNNKKKLKNGSSRSELARGANHL